MGTRKLKLIVWVLLLLAFVANIAGLVYLYLQIKKNDTSLASSSSPQVELTIGSAVNLEYLNLTDQQKKGRMFMVSIEGTTLSDDTAQFLKTNKISGVILMPGNIENETQLKQLSSDLKTKVDERLIVAIDQEGGSVVRLTWDKYAQYSARQIGNGKSPDLEEIFEYRAGLLKDLGINLILGPVVDLAGSSSFIYDRSYGNDAAHVSELVAKEVEIYHQNGIMTAPKHFPGHGATSTDSHFDFPVINKSKQQLSEYEFIPFQAAIDNDSEFVMAGHIINPQISSKPASISPEYRQILEDDMGFEGLVITDDLKMTGEIDGGINWGLNLSIEDRNATLIRLSSISPEEKYVKKILELRYKKL